MNKEEILINTQLALFFELPLSRPDELWQLFNAEMGGIFDKVPLTLPIPNESQLLEVPVVQMTSSKGIYSGNIARGRVDYFHSGVGKQNFSDIKNNFLDEIEKYFNFFSSKTKIKRIGFVTKFFMEDKQQDKTIAKLLNKKFIELHDNNVHEAYIRYVSRIKIGEFNVNDLTIVERFSARVSGVGDNIKGIMITRDFNTVPEENYSNKLSEGKIKTLIKEAEGCFNLKGLRDILWPKTNK